MKGQFANYHSIYAMIYKSQLVFEERNHVTFSGMLPDWMFTWCTLCSSPPGARFYFLPVGRTKKIWGKSTVLSNMFYHCVFLVSGTQCPQKSIEACNLCSKVSNFL